MRSRIVDCYSFEEYRHGRSATAVFAAHSDWVHGLAVLVREVEEVRCRVVMDQLLYIHCCSQASVVEAEVGYTGLYLIEEQRIDLAVEA